MRLLLIILLLPLLCAGDWSDVLIKAIDHIAKLLEKDNNKKGESLKKKIIVEPSHVPHGKLLKPKPVPIETPSPPPPPLPAPLMPLPLPQPSLPSPPPPPKEEHGHRDIDFRPRPPLPPIKEKEERHPVEHKIVWDVEGKGEDLEKPRCTVTLYDDVNFNGPQEGSDRFHSNAKLIIAESTHDLGPLSKAASSVRVSNCQDKVVSFWSTGRQLWTHFKTEDFDEPNLGRYWYNDLFDAVEILDYKAPDSNEEVHILPDIGFLPQTPPPPPPEEETSHSTQAPIESEEEKGENLEKPRCTVTLFDDWHFNRPEEGGEHFHSNAKLILAESEDDLGDLSNAASSIRLSLCQDQVVTFSSNGEELPLILSGNAEMEFLGQYNDLIDAVHIRDKTSEEDESSEEEAVEEADAKEENLQLLRFALAGKAMRDIMWSRLVSQQDARTVYNAMIRLVKENAGMWREKKVDAVQEAENLGRFSIRLLVQATQDIFDQLPTVLYGLNNRTRMVVKQAIIAVADEYAVKLLQRKILRE